MSIPEGTQTGTVFRLQGQGHSLCSTAGAGATSTSPCTIETPRNLNKEQKEALRKFSETVGENNYEKRKSFFKKK